MSINLPHGESFTVQREKYLAMQELVQDMYTTGLGAKWRTLYFLNFNIKNENFQILNASLDG
jgi:hypothetical protein